jgi:aryl-alcohol dehydrogenase-like predicted oxidoreductase
MNREIFDKRVVEGMAVAPLSILGGDKFKRAVMAEREVAESRVQVHAPNIAEADYRGSMENCEGNGNALMRMALMWALEKQPCVSPTISGRKMEQLKTHIEAIHFNSSIMTAQQRDASITPSHLDHC